MSLSAGTRLGPHEILSLIGAGGMGEVYKARDTRLDRIVAIKVSREQFSERFEREARAVAALNHPHICQLYDVGPNYLVMEFVEGQPLAGPLPLEKAVEYAGQILDALDAAHRKGITHRDLKPANILVTKQGIKLLADPITRLGRRASGARSLSWPVHSRPKDGAHAPPGFRGTIYNDLTGRGWLVHRRSQHFGDQAGREAQQYTCRCETHCSADKASSSAHCNLAYSALACRRTGTSGSASFHKPKKSWNTFLAFAASPASANPRAIPKYESE